MKPSSSAIEAAPSSTCTAKTPSVNPHISEAGIAVHQDDLLLPNNGTISDFLGSLEEVFCTLHKQHKSRHQPKDASA